jgi:hypothetical protein
VLLKPVELDSCLAPVVNSVVPVDWTPGEELEPLVASLASVVDSVPGVLPSVVVPVVVADSLVLLKLGTLDSNVDELELRPVVLELRLELSVVEPVCSVVSPDEVDSCGVLDEPGSDELCTLDDEPMVDELGFSLGAVDPVFELVLDGSSEDWLAV